MPLVNCKHISSYARIVERLKRKFMTHIEMLEKLVELKIVFQIGSNDEGEPYWGLHLEGSNCL